MAVKISRAEFLQIVAGLTAWLGSSGFARSFAPVTDKARALPLSAVRLTGGPLKRAQELDGAYLLSLETDRLAASYRKLAGLAPKAELYGGWDGAGRNLTGHIAGHYLSAVSLMFAATGDERFKQRADALVAELKAVQDAHGDGFAGALEGVKQAFADVSKGTIRSANFDLNGLWSPWYTLHKTFGGLRDAYRYTGNSSARDVSIKFAGWAERVLAPMNEEQVQRMLATEFGGMNEVLADLFADTGDERWLVLSRRFEHRAVLDPLKRREDPLDGLHGNTQVPKLLGSAARYAYAGDPADLAAASFFWDRVVNHHTFATGGHGKDEYFREPDRLSHITEGRTAETCNVYNMLKLTRRLFALQPDIQYAEFHERALFNHILGSMDPTDGATCYMVPVGRSVRREYQDMNRSFTCCVGSGLESHALHGLGLYYESGNRLWVNLYAPSTATWESAGVGLTMETSFPEGDAATLTIATRAPKDFTLALRRPSWARDGFAVTVNGQPAGALGAPGSYVEIARTWKSGDTVSLKLPKTVRLDRLADNPQRAVVMWGPLVLAGDLGPEPERTPEGPRRSAPETPTLVTERAGVDWLTPVAGRPGVFRTAGVTRNPLAAQPTAAQPDVELVPFHQLRRRTYVAYWDVLTPAEYAVRTTELTAERERVRKLEAATIVYVPAGETDGEKPFNMRGEDTSIIRADGRPGRRAAKWFSYDVGVTAGTPAALVITYNSDNRRARSFEIGIDGRRLAEESQPQGSVSRFFDVEYKLPPDLVAGKSTITVKFQATGGNETAPVFGVRLVR
jgi:uncharacterized protein